MGGWARTTSPEILSPPRISLWKRKGKKRRRMEKRATEKRGREQPGVSWRFITATLYAARRRARVAFKKNKERKKYHQSRHPTVYLFAVTFLPRRIIHTNTRCTGMHPRGCIQPSQAHGVHGESREEKKVPRRALLQVASGNDTLFKLA